MEKLFGLEMATIAVVLSVLLALVLVGLALLALRRPVFLKLGLRPIPRRRAQSILIVTGLMLATLIITAAFVTGDTLSYSIRSVAIEGMGEIDETIQAGGGYFKFARYEALAQDLAGYPLVDRFLPAIGESAPVVNLTQRRSLRRVSIMGLQAEDAWVLPREELTGADGQALSLAELGPGEVYLNAGAAEALGAAPGDTLEVYTGSHPRQVTVRAVAARGETPRMLMTLRQAQVMFNQRGRVNVILVSNLGDALGGAAHSQAVTAHLRGLLSDPKVAARLYAALAADPAAAQALRAAAAGEEGNTQADLLALARGLEAGSLSAETRSLLADERLGDRVQSILVDTGWGSPLQREEVAKLFGDLSELAVAGSKRDTLDESDLAASAFTALFVASGLFGITAGLVLIFLIFVMLAAERKSEMGMARAVGAQRGHLVEMFVFEGTAYDLAAAAVGVALGVGVGLVIALTLGQAFAGVGLGIRPNVNPRSLLVSFSLGMLVTFATVLASANRVSRLNIVSAIRDLPDPPRPPRYLRDRLLAPLRAVADGFRALFRLRILRALRAWLFGVPGSLLRLAWLGFTGGPFTLLLGLLLVSTGLQAASGSAFSMGVSFAIVGGGLVLRWILRGLFGWAQRGGPRLRSSPGSLRPYSWDAAGLAERVAFSLLGLALTVYWALPSRALQENLGIPEMSSGPEMLFISGVFIVGGAVLLLMYNTDLLLRLLLLALGRSPRFAPVLRMAIAYPLASRFRTGMTIAIFAVVMFSVIFMATLFKVNDILLTDTQRFTGGFDLRVETSSHNPVENLARAIAARPELERADYAVIASLANLYVEARQDRSGRWAGYPIQAADEAYLDSVDTTLSVMPEGYATTEEVWAAVRDHPGYALVDPLAVPSRAATSIIIGGPEFRLQGVYLEDETMKPVQIEVREPGSGATFELTVIGVLEQTTLTGYGILTSRETLERGLDAGLPAPTYLVRLAEGVDPGAAGAALESAFLKNGLESVDLVKEIRDAMATQYVFQWLLLGFLTVGLVVGVAALGVISTRAVVERRQQIGMLRALGFQREMVSWIFLIESSFVSLLGIGLGAGLALIPAAQMIADMAVDIPGITFQAPWTEILLISGLAYAMTLLTTWLPAVQAARVLPAEALRYE